MIKAALNTCSHKGLLEEEFEFLTSKNEYVETKIVTKYGEFFTRVYRSLESKETVVLWAGKILNTSPPLVRVHSECFTGDVIKSLKCDCGKQLDKSMHLIQKKGGILIYLRQEGRGIGLFEKIKAYELQFKGYDTFEANTILGHRPDARTYEMVKVVLDDFSISRICLLTNNPSKVSEIAKYGIDIVQTVPLLIHPNKYNRKYFQTKTKKFNHSFSEKHETYFFGFQIDEADEFKKISKRISTKFNDPLLKLCIGVKANFRSLELKKERARIQGVYNVVKNFPNVFPVLHFSFLNSKFPMKDLQEIQRVYPFVKRIQLNDVGSLSYSFLKKAFELFNVYLPISDDNFHILDNSKIRGLIKRHQSTILLDNSKGTGKIETFESYKDKIDKLFDWDLRKVALCGGFGPYKLHTYFSLKRYYRVNFSIDSESSLKKSKKVDVDLTVEYLRQLLELSVPNLLGVEQTRAFIKKHRRSDWDTIKVEGRDFFVHPKVFHSGKFPSSLWYAKIISKLVSKEEDFCEVGCGSGLTSCLVAYKNPKIRIFATDINPHAAENTEKNAVNFNVAKRIKTTTSDVLDGLKENNEFNTIFWALPFGFLDHGTKLSLEETQVFDPGYRAIRKFFETAKKHLRPQGRLLIGFSTELGDGDLLQKLAYELSLELTKIDAIRLKEEREIEFELLEGKYLR